MSAHNDFFTLLRQSRILIVDDDEDMSEIIRIHFQHEGYTHLDNVTSGQAALKRINEAVRTKTPYNLVLLDLRLPGDTSGQDVYKSILQSIDVPIVVMSAVSDREAIIDALRAGRDVRM